MTADPRADAASCRAAQGVRYADYLCLDALLSAQRPRSHEVPPAIHDEHFFIVLHQAQELWFKQILREMAAVLALDPAQAVFFEAALPMLERIVAVESSLVLQLGLLRTLDPAQFNAMRPLLGSASGAQSLQFRLIQATTGMLARSGPQADLGLLPRESEEQARVRAVMASPSLHDVVVNALEHEARRRHVNLQSMQQGPGAPSLCGGFDELPPAATALLEQLLDDPSGGDERRDRTIRLAVAALCRFEDELLAWRDAHADIVRDLLDELPGTGGTAGHAYLRAQRLSQPRSALARAMRGAAGTSA